MSSASTLECTTIRRVLVVDDNRAIHGDFRKIFQSGNYADAGFEALRAKLFPGTTREVPAQSYDLDFASQGEDGLELVQKAIDAGQPYSVVFLDVRMPPGWDGIETCERIWAVDPEVQVVLATAFSDHPWEEIVARLGGNDRLVILKKPFDSVEIRQLASTLSRKWDLARAARRQVADLEEIVAAKTRDLERTNDALRAKIEEADLANRAKSEFLSNMSHEIRTPMTAILGFADLLCEPGLSQDEISQHVHTIQRNRDHLLKLINDILDLSKIEAGAMTLEKVPCSPAAILREVLGMLELRAGEKRLVLSSGAGGPIPETIVTDPTRLRQILVNLVANAIKFTERGGVHVHVRMAPPRDGRGPAIAFDVTDTGIGLEPEQRERLFKAFSQADSSTTRRFGGSGLGLSISLRLAELLGGGITVQSTPGRGSTFTATLETGPLEGVRMLPFSAREEATSEAEDDELEEGMTARAFGPRLSAHVLLAEDGRDNQRLIQLYLVRAGATVEIVEDGSEALSRVLLAMAAGAPHDLILMDMQMPQMDGYTATRKIREAGFRGPIVALTAHAMTGDRERCLEAGCDEYAAKPIDRSNLIALCTRLLGRGDSVPAPLPRLRPLQPFDRPADRRNA